MQRSCCTFTAHAPQPPPETLESDPAPCRHYGGASVRKSRRTFLVHCRHSARPARISLNIYLAFHDLVSLCLFDRSSNASSIAAARSRSKLKNLIDLVVTERRIAFYRLPPTVRFRCRLDIHQLQV